MSTNSREYSKAYYEAHREDLLTRAKDYREVNRDKILEDQREYREANKESLNEAKRQYYQDNKDRISAHRKARYQSTKEDRSAYNRAWREKYPEYHREYYKKNRGRINAKNRDTYRKDRAAIAAYNEAVAAGILFGAEVGEPIVRAVTESIISGMTDTETLILAYITIVGPLSVRDIEEAPLPLSRKEIRIAVQALEFRGFLVLNDSLELEVKQFLTNGVCCYKLKFERGGY